MFEDRTTENLKKEVLAQIGPQTGISKMAGSFADAMAGPLCQQLAQFYQALPAVVSMLFVDETSGPFLDLVGKDYLGLTRREGTRATCTVDFTGTPGTRVEAGTRFYTADGLVFNLDTSVALGPNGSAVGSLTAEQVGEAYNIPPDSLTNMQVNLQGLDRYANHQALGGSDPESDRALYQRIVEARQQPDTSGNGWDYRQWAMAVDGVGQAKIVELPQGPGTVGITLITPDLLPAGEELQQSVLAHVEGLRPIGARVLVDAPTTKEITVSAAVTVDPSTTPGAVQTAFTQALRDHLVQIVEKKYQKIYYNPNQDAPYTLYYNRVLALLLTINGVETFSTLTINGGTEDIILAASQVPQLGEVDVT